MIVFDLRCSRAGHVFEAWFGSSGDYETQQARGLVECPLCGCQDIEKAVMAPRVSAKGNRSSETSVPVAAPAGEEMKAMLAALAAAQRKLLENSDYVGERFADEARAIHLGESEARPIHGKATAEQTQSLVEDGISVSPLPFPVAEPGREN